MIGSTSKGVGSGVTVNQTETFEGFKQGKQIQYLFSYSGLLFVSILNGF